VWLEEAAALRFHLEGVCLSLVSWGTGDGGRDVRTFVTAVWKVMSWRGWLALLENVTFNNIGPSGIGRLTSVTTRKFESIISISLDFSSELEGSAEVKAQSPSSWLG